MFNISNIEQYCVINMYIDNWIIHVNIHQLLKMNIQYYVLDFLI
jgi:hypothetical protein